MSKREKKTLKLTKGNIQKTILLGINEAAYRYGKTSGWAIDLAPEYYLTCKIAELLNENFERQVALEVSVMKTRKQAKASRRGRKNKATSGRFDIVMYDNDDVTPVAIIEVKNPVTSITKDRVDPDIKRIVSSISQNRSDKNQKKNKLRFGAFAFTSHHYGRRTKNNGESKSHEQCVKELIDRIEAHAKKLAEKKTCNAEIYSYHKPVNDDKDGEKPYTWCSACVIFTPSLP